MNSEDIVDQPESIEPEVIKLPRARLSLKLPEKREVSYKDLYCDFLHANGVNDHSTSSDESESENYSYPAFMQRIIERLDKYGQLALRDQIGIHKSDPRKKRKTEEKDLEDEKEYAGQVEGEESSENSCEMYYDLSDNFIDDSEIQQSGGNEETELNKAINEGFFIVNVDEYLKTLPRTPKKPKKVKEKKETPKVNFQKKPDVDISHLSTDLKDRLEELKKLYEDKRKEGNTAPFPKGTVKILEKFIKLIDGFPADYESLFNNISLISGQSAESVKAQFEKTRKKMQKSGIQSQFNKSFRLFKKNLLTAEYKWNPKLRTEFLSLLELLHQVVDAGNAAGSRNKKPGKSQGYLEDEAKVIAEIKKLSNGKLDACDLKAEISDIASQMEPVMSDNFDDPTYKIEDFEKITD